MIRAFEKICLAALAACLAGCGTTDPPYYTFAVTRGLQHDGFIVGIEKRDSDLVGAPEKRSDDPRFRLATGSEVLNEEYLERTDDDEALFVSQVYESLRTPDGRFVSYDRWNAHDPDGDGVFRDSLLIEPSDAYDRGYAALDDLGQRISSKLAEGRHTHVVLMAMGWHNDQVESIARYNAILHNVRKAAAPDRFEPLVVGITWPSAWGSGSTNPLVEKLGHIGSYFNKTRDADEIGYTIANYLLNTVVLPRAGDHPVILLGHSFGARLLSRAAFSRGHLSSLPATRRASLFIGLQAAVSVNRFIPSGGGEGSPYSGFVDHATRYVMTSSLNDAANPWARLATGAANAGGWFGLGEARRHPDTYAVADWTAISDDSGWAFPDRRVVLIDASDIVNGDGAVDVWGGSPSAHNDILDEEMGRLIWFFVRRAP